MLGLEHIISGRATRRDVFKVRFRVTLVDELLMLRTQTLMLHPLASDKLGGGSWGG